MPSVILGAPIIIYCMYPSGRGAVDREFVGIPTNITHIPTIARMSIYFPKFVNRVDSANLTYRKVFSELFAKSFGKQLSTNNS